MVPTVETGSYRLEGTARRATDTSPFSGAPWPGKSAATRGGNARTLNPGARVKILGGVLRILCLWGGPLYVVGEWVHPYVLDVLGLTDGTRDPSTTIGGGGP